MTNKLADVALGLEIILARLPYRAVDDDHREEAVIPVACHRRGRSPLREKQNNKAPEEIKQGAAATPKGATKKGERQTQNAFVSPIGLWVVVRFFSFQM